VFRTYQATDGCGDEQSEEGLVRFLQGLISECKSDGLSRSYGQYVNTFYEQEHGPDAGVGMVNAGLDLRCRALNRALDDMS